MYEIQKNLIGKITKFRNSNQVYFTIFMKKYDRKLGLSVTGNVITRIHRRWRHGRKHVCWHYGPTAYHWVISTFSIRTASPRSRFEAIKWSCTLVPPTVKSALHQRRHLEITNLIKLTTISVNLVSRSAFCD